MPHGMLKTSGGSLLWLEPPSHGTELCQDVVFKIRHCVRDMMRRHPGSYKWSDYKERKICYVGNIFQGIFVRQQTETIAPSEFLILIAASLVVGLILAAAYMYKSLYNKGFVATLALLPAVVCVIIMMVNGNIGTGVAVMGAFNLVRFRSAPGSAKEICAIFMAMATGLIMGMGYVAYGFLCAIVLGLARTHLRKHRLRRAKEKRPSQDSPYNRAGDLDYTGAFDSAFFRNIRQKASL